jgi:hypothetical protein
MKKYKILVLAGALCALAGCSDSSAVGTGPDPNRAKPPEKALNEMPPEAKEALSRQSQIANEAASRSANYYKNRGGQ